MFFINLVEALCKRTHISREVLNQIIDELHAHCPKYLCKIEHKKGLIIQIDKRMFSAARFVVADLPESTV